MDIVEGCREKGMLVQCWWECKFMQPLTMESPPKLKVELLYDPAVPLLGIYLDKTETLIRRETCIPVFIALFVKARIWKQPKCPSRDEWMKKM